jgi:hypothetical protein
MKTIWPWFVVVTILCWGAYVPTIHHGQSALGRNSALRAFMLVGVAYFVTAGLTLGYVLLSRSEPWSWTRSGVGLSFLAGVVGAIGALGVVFALKTGGKPLLVAPLVFAGAPLVNTAVSMIWDRPGHAPHPLFFFGIVLAGVGAALMLGFKPH